MTLPTPTPASHPQNPTRSTSVDLSRRSFLSFASAVAATGAATQLLARDYGPNAQPVRYPDPDIVVLDDRFKKYKLGNAPIQRLHSLSAGVACRIRS